MGAKRYTMSQVASSAFLALVTGAAITGGIAPVRSAVAGIFRESQAAPQPLKSSHPQDPKAAMNLGTTRGATFRLKLVDDNLVAEVTGDAATRVSNPRIHVEIPDGETIKSADGKVIARYDAEADFGSSHSVVGFDGKQLRVSVVAMVNGRNEASPLAADISERSGCLESAVIANPLASVQRDTVGPSSVYLGSC